MAENIKVAVRVRKLNDRENGYKNNSAKWATDAGQLSHPPLSEGSEEISYNFGPNKSPSCHTHTNT